ncbi:MAG: hypothetical protein V1914_03785 [archaeon]
MIGTKYEQSLKDLLTKEFEYQLDIKIETEEEFVEACEDYLNLEKVNPRPVNINLKIKNWSCYLCYQPSDKPVIISEGDSSDFSQTAFHQECIKKAAVNYLFERKFKTIDTLWDRREIAKLIRFPPQ